MLEKLNKLYFDSFCNFWIPIYKRQVFKAKIENNLNALIDIQCNIWKNINLNNEQKNYILETLKIKKIKYRGVK
jgi:hypothetical protein